MLILNKPNNREEEMKKEKMMKHFGDFMMFILTAKTTFCGRGQS